MYNIDLYTYWKKPFTNGKNFSIRPLDEEGKETYYSDKSHVRHYLKRTDPFVFKSIVGVDYDTLVRQQKEDIQMLKNLKEKGFKPKETNQINNVQKEEEKVEHQIDTTKDQPNINTLNNPDIHKEGYGQFNDKHKMFKPFSTQT